MSHVLLQELFISYIRLFFFFFFLYRATLLKRFGICGIICWKTLWRCVLEPSPITMALYRFERLTKIKKKALIIFFQRFGPTPTHDCIEKFTVSIYLCARISFFFSTYLTMDCLLLTLINDCRPVIDFLSFMYLSISIDF